MQVYGKTTLPLDNVDFIDLIVVHAEGMCLSQSLSHTPQLDTFNWDMTMIGPS